MAPGLSSTSGGSTSSTASVAYVTADGTAVAGAGFCQPRNSGDEGRASCSRLGAATTDGGPPLDPADVVFVGDRPVDDISGAQAFGMRTILIGGSLRSGGVPDQAVAWAVDAVGMFVAASAVEDAITAELAAEGRDPGGDSRRRGLPRQ